MSHLRSENIILESTTRRCNLFDVETISVTGGNRGDLSPEVT
jgi:hypothetical protein